MLSNTTQEKIAVLGPAPTFSSSAAHEMCKDAWIDASFTTIGQVVEAVRDGEALLGVVPLRNSTVGDISDTLKALEASPEVAIVLRREIPISLSLIAQPDVNPVNLLSVISKRQALDQCRGWLKSHIPSVELVEAGSTSEGMENVLANRSIALVASRELAQGGLLQVIAEDIQDNSNNCTEFAVIVRPDVFGLPGNWEDEKSSAFPAHNRQ
jgi:chorismate mutase/prephenate dehydratase